MTDLAPPTPPFWQPAEARKQLWRTLLGVVVIAGVYLGVSTGVIFGLAAALGLTAWQVAEASTPQTAAVFFLTFLGFYAGLALVLPVLHRRGPASLFGPSRSLNLRYYALGTLAALAIAAALYLLLGIEHLVLPAGTSPPLIRNFALSPWLIWLVPALALIFMQTLAEELVFRGYLLQQLRARFRSPFIWAVLPALAFGLLHFDAATYGRLNAAAYVLNAAVLGALAAFITIRTGNLAAAAGVHFGNNAMMVLFGLEGSLDGFSLFTVALDFKSGYTTYSILTQTAVMVLAFWAWWRWMNRHRPIANGDDDL